MAPDCDHHQGKARLRLQTPSHLKGASSVSVNPEPETPINTLTKAPGGWGGGRPGLVCNPLAPPRPFLPSKF